MTGRERIRAAMKNLETDRVPWVPFVGCHAGSLIGAGASEYLRSEDLIVRGIGEAVNRYAPDGVPVMFDLQVEAEALGCSLVWADENPPAVSSHPLSGGKVLSDLCVPGPDDGRIGMVYRAAGRLRKEHPDIALYGLVTGPFTLAMHLAGTDLFMKMFDDPASVRELMAFAQSVTAFMSDLYFRAGCDVIAVVDPMTSQIGPEHFREFVKPHVLPVFEGIRARGALGSFFVCGQAQQNIEAMCDCRPDNISVDENIPLDYVRDVCRPRGVSFGGNLQLTIVLLLGTPEDAQRDAVACLETGGKTGFILAPGCDLPYSTPPANIEAVTQVVQDPYRRQVVMAMSGRESRADLLDMHEYGSSDKVIVDIITLDSEACAPCQYMVESVKAIMPEFEGIVEWREHKIKRRDSLVFMTSLMVKNIPTICIDGKITFVSRIPKREELIAAVQKRINEKLRFKIRAKRSTVYLLGRTEKEIAALRESVGRAIEELGAEVNMEEVTGKDDIQALGVSVTPAVVVARYQVKAQGAMPSAAVVKEWIKDIT